MAKKNQLFIHPTDLCNLDCAFCVYAQERKKGLPCANLDLTKGFATKSLSNLAGGAQHIAFSGGGEPFLNLESVLSCMSLNKNRKYMITTGLGLPLEELKEKIDKLNQACCQSDSYCVVRISTDSFHHTMDFSCDCGTVLRWFLEKQWDHVRTCFIRGTVAEGAQLLKNLKDFCTRNQLLCVSRKMNDFIYAFIIQGQFFQVILRPTIYPTPEELSREDLLLEYIDKMMEIDSEKVYLGKPRSCRGCKGCGSWNSGMENGLDVTVNAKGDVFLYGAEIASLANIYTEEVSYDLLEQRVRNLPEMELLQSFDIRHVMENFSNDETLGDLVRRINYPFAVIRECMREHREDVYRVIRQMGD